MLIKLEDITIRNGNKNVFNNTNWLFDERQHWAILGPNGSGKTVFTKALIRQLPIVHGQIYYGFDKPTNQLWRSFLYPGEILLFSSETHRAFLRKYANYHQARWQSFEGEQNPSVSKVIDPNEISKINPFEITKHQVNPSKGQKRDYLLDLFGIRHLLNKQIHQLSHGESRKVFLTRLLLRSPKLIILDDLYTGLDRSTRDALRIAIDLITRTHDQPILIAANRFDDLPESITHVMVINEQQVVAQGETHLVPVETYEQIDQKPDVKIVNAPISFLNVTKRYSETIQNQTKLTVSPFVKMHNVSVVYGKTKVLQNINWLVCRGDRWALQGPNGAGKSTLLGLILADHPQAYSQAVSIFGKRRGSGESIWDIKKNIGWVSPELHIFYEPQTTCLQVVESGYYDSVGLYRHGSNTMIESARNFLAAFGLSSLENQPFNSVSAGQQRMVLLARSLIKSPPLLILDEPCQGLDPIHRNTFLRLIDDLCRFTPITMIYVTHYQEELPSMVTHTMFLEKGVIIRSGPV